MSPTESTTRTILAWCHTRQRMRLTSQQHSVLLGTGTMVPAKSQRQCCEWWCHTQSCYVRTCMQNDDLTSPHGCSVILETNRLWRHTKLLYTYGSDVFNWSSNPSDVRSFSLCRHTKLFLLHMKMMVGRHDLWSSNPSDARSFSLCRHTQPFLLHMKMMVGRHDPWSSIPSHVCSFSLCRHTKPFLLHMKMMVGRHD